MSKFLRQIFALIFGAAAFFGCGLVDEDMSDCETDYDINYELKLVTNMTTELSTELTTGLSTELSLAANLQMAASLKAYLQEVFTDFAHDVDLSFYDVVADEAVGDSLRLHHEYHIIDANQTTYNLYIPLRPYMHLAVANIADNGVVALEGDGLCHSSRLVQEVKDTIGNHKTGLFTARMPLDIVEGVSQTFNVGLYMANCASSLIIDTLDSHIRDLRVFATGFATAFNICDSTYNFQYTPVVRPDRVESPESGLVCFTAVTFPSREPEDLTRSIMETTDPFVSESAVGSLWRYYVYATMPDGTITETILGVFKPLRAGQFKIIKVKLYPNGTAQPSDPTVGVNITTDWTPGGEINVDL